MTVIRETRRISRTPQLFNVSISVLDAAADDFRSEDSHSGHCHLYRSNMCDEELQRLRKSAHILLDRADL